MNSGVDILLDDLTESNNGIIPLHALLRINKQSGFLMIQGIDDRHPVRYSNHYGSAILGHGKCHCLWQMANTFSIGNVDFILTYAQLNQAQMKNLRQVRDRAFKTRGLQAPIGQLPISPPLSTEGHTLGYNMLCYKLLFSVLGFGRYGVVRVAVDIITGNLCAVKSVLAKTLKEREEALREADVLLKFPVCKRIFGSNNCSMC